MQIDSFFPGNAVEKTDYVLNLPMDNHNKSNRVAVAALAPSAMSIVIKWAQERCYSLMMASTGAEVINYSVRDKADLIVISDRLSDMTVGELCNQLRKSCAVWSPYLMTIITGADTAQYEELADIKVNDILVSPVNESLLKFHLSKAEDYFSARNELNKMRMENNRLQEALVVQKNDLERMMNYLAGANARFEELFNSIPIACFGFDIDNKIYDWNKSAQSLYGYNSHEVLQKPIWNLILPEPEKKTFNCLLLEVKEGKSVNLFEMKHKNQVGDLFDALCSLFPMYDHNKQLNGYVLSVIDITERKMQEKQIKEQKRALEEANSKLMVLATTDGLTGLKNHRAFHSALQEALTTTSEHKMPLSLIMLDVDLFKQYNDKYGHPKGDDLLKQLAQTMTEHIGETYFIARYGGEEFAIILPEMYLDESVELAERLRKSVEATLFDTHNITVSLGIACTVDSGNTSEDIISAADKALYASKTNGRNCTTGVTLDANKTPMSEARLNTA